MQKTKTAVIRKTDSSKEISVKDYPIKFDELDLNPKTIEQMQFRESLFNSGDKVLIRLAETAEPERIDKLLRILKYGGSKIKQITADKIVADHLAELKERINH